MQNVHIPFVCHDQTRRKRRWKKQIKDELSCDNFYQIYICVIFLLNYVYTLVPISAKTSFFTIFYKHINLVRVLHHLFKRKKKREFIIIFQKTMTIFYLSHYMTLCWNEIIFNTFDEYVLINQSRPYVPEIRV